MKDAWNNWYTKNRVQFTWFVIGWLAMALLEAISRGELWFVVIDAILLAINVRLALNNDQF